MAAPRRVVIVGASLAGTRAAQALRDRGFDGELALIGSEPHLPYDRPPLSKSVLGSGADPGIGLLAIEEIDALRIDLRIGQTATALRPAERKVELSGGEQLRYDALVIATGCAARMPVGWDRLDGVHRLRTLDDGLALRAALQGSPRVAVVGAGFIGSEVAATARGLGLDVTLIDPLPAPLAGALGPDAAEACTGLHADAGVRLRCSASVAGVEGSGRVERVRLSDGGTIDADVVVVGIGVRPVTDWLAGSGVAVGDGVLCDARCATTVPDVYAAGDVARWHNPTFGEEMRVEHWTNASEQAAFVARAILEGAASGGFAAVPFVWSEQHGVRIEIAGLPRPGDRLHIVEGSFEARQFVALYERRGRLAAALAFNASRQLLRYRRLLATGPSWPEVRRAALSSA
jgi:3-phenylpropionate/trans-cinnamate dioxygenase ferredoxin reductase subunit